MVVTLLLGTGGSSNGQNGVDRLDRDYHLRFIYRRDDLGIIFLTRPRDSADGNSMTQSAQLGGGQKNN